VANKLAMSRALGAAFLTHQVEQLEKSVHAADARSFSTRGRNNYQRERKSMGDRGGRASAGVNRRTPLPIGGIKVATKANSSSPPFEGATAGPMGVGGAQTPQSNGARKNKDADIVVIDASVLVNALGQIKKWCRDDREEILIVPLEALNTLDLLKKGTSVLAQRARAASRVLESQVGTNTRVRVQRDQAYVLWDSIPFEPTPDNESQASPEWVRRTICCAQWEATHAADELVDLKSPPAQPAVVFAILANPPPTARAPSPLPTTTVASPVPLPVLQVNKHEPRSSGALVLQWARRAKLPVLEVAPTAAFEHQGRNSSEEEREQHPANRRGRRRNSNTRDSGSGEKGRSLVERPPAVKAMMDAAVAQPTRVVRVLARGEKLEP